MTTGPDVDLVCVGFTVLDVLVRHVEKLPDPGDSLLVDEIRMTAAGTAAGPAVMASRLGLRARLIGAVGDDRMGDVVLQALADENVDTEAVQIVEGVPTSTSVLPISPNGERPAFHAPGASILMQLEPPFDAALGARFLHYGGPGLHPEFDGQPARDLVREAKARGVTVTVDVIAVGSHTLDALEPILPYVDYFMPTTAEAMEVSGRATAEEAARFFLDLGAGACVLKDGARGSLLVQPDGVVGVPAFEVDVVDTTGCGDSYCAGFIAGLSHGLDVEAACRTASATAALVATGLGSDAGVTSYDAVVRATERLTEKTTTGEQG
jgi:sugar/nucleoside kinase (ribokinase family)